MQPDEVDWQIIHLLSDEHLSNSEVARRMGISEGTVRLRLKRLQEAGLLRLRAERNPDLIANQQLALVATNVNNPRLLDAKAREISELKHVISVAIVSGQYDILIEVLVDSNHGLIKFLTEELATVEGLSKTETFLYLRTYKKWV